MLRLSRHARKRAEERGIALEEIEQAVRDHDVSFSDAKGNPCYVRGFGERRVKVVIARDDPKFVITVIDLDEPEDTDAR